MINWIDCSVAQGKSLNKVGTKRVSHLMLLIRFPVKERYIKQSLQWGGQTRNQIKTIFVVFKDRMEELVGLLEKAQKSDR